MIQVPVWENLCKTLPCFDPQHPDKLNIAHTMDTYGLIWSKSAVLWSYFHMVATVGVAGHMIQQWSWAHVLHIDVIVC